jgi:hypothetical protein
MHAEDEVLVVSRELSRFRDFLSKWLPASISGWKSDRAPVWKAFNEWARTTQWPGFIVGVKFTYD